MQALECSVGQGEYQIVAHTALCGQDVVVVVGGGGLPHVGAVAVASAHPSLKDASRAGASVSVITVQGHKEDEIARAAALRLAKSLRRNVAISVGIHIDNATSQQIETLVASFHQLIGQVEEQVSAFLGEKRPGSAEPDQPDVLPL